MLQDSDIFFSEWQEGYLHNLDNLLLETDPVTGQISVTCIFQESAWYEKQLRFKGDWPEQFQRATRFTFKVHRPNLSLTVFAHRIFSVNKNTDESITFVCEAQITADVSPAVRARA